MSLKSPLLLAAEGKYSPVKLGFCDAGDEGRQCTGPGQVFAGAPNPLHPGRHISAAGEAQKLGVPAALPACCSRAQRAGACQGGASTSRCVLSTCISCQDNCFMGRAVTPPCDSWSLRSIPHSGLITLEHALRTSHRSVACDEAA